MLATFVLCVGLNVVIGFMINGGLERSMAATNGEQGPWWFPVNFKGDVARQTGWEEKGEAGAVHEAGAGGLQQELSEMKSVLQIAQMTTMVIPGLMAIWAVLGVQSGEQYARWVAIGLVWCIAGNFLQHLLGAGNVGIQGGVDDFLVMMLAYTVANFAFVLAFSAADDDDDAGTPLMPVRMLLCLGAAFSLFMAAKEEGASESNRNAALAAFLGVAGCMCWRAAARIGYGLFDVNVYGSLPQWLGCTGALSLSFSHLFLLASKTSPYPKIDSPMLPAFEHMAQLFFYWIGVVCICASTLMPQRPFDKGH